MRAQAQVRPAGIVDEALANMIRSAIGAHVDDIAHQAATQAVDHLGDIVGTDAQQQAQGAAAMQSYAATNVLPKARVVAAVALGLAIAAGVGAYRCVTR